MTKYRHDNCKILVPKTEWFNSSNIVSGSGIVGISTDDIDLIYYEGNLFGAENLTELKDRVLIAAGRLMTRYPTTAFFATHSDYIEQNFHVVGYVSIENQKLVAYIEDNKTFNSWADRYLESNKSINKIVDGDIETSIAHRP